MKKEIRMQSALIKSIRKGGGRAKKTDGAHSSGWPDLFISYGTSETCFMECKRLVNWNTNRRRTLELRDSQCGFMNAWGKFYVWFLLGVFAEIDGEQWFTTYRPAWQEGRTHSGRFSLDRNDIRKFGTPFVTEKTADEAMVKKLIVDPRWIGEAEE